jgi:predicted RNA-binding Zn ribbon-like protein
MISDEGTEPGATCQVQLDSYDEFGVLTAVELVNELSVGHAYGRAKPPADAHAPVARILATDPPSAARLRARDLPGFVVLAGRLHGVFEALDRGDVDAAAVDLNALLADHPAHPHLAKEGGRWRLHHHPADAALVPMTTAICAEGLARVIGAGDARRLGTCADAGCERVFLDLSKNGSRRFCSTTCQNRVKAAAFRGRHAT